MNLFFYFLEGPLTIINAAPAIPDVDKEIFKLAHITCVNECEVNNSTNSLINNVLFAVKYTSFFLL